MFRISSVVILAVAMTLPMIVVAHGDDEETVQNESSIEILQPSNYAIVPPTFTLVFSEPVDEKTAHLFLLIDTDPVDEGKVISEDDNHIRLSSRKNEHELSLPEGEHWLLLQGADEDHIALGDAQTSQVIMVNVVEDAAPRGIYIVNPMDGATVPPHFPVIIAATGLILDVGDTTADAHPHLYVSKAESDNHEHIEPSHDSGGMIADHCDTIIEHRDGHDDEAEDEHDHEDEHHDEAEDAHDHDDEHHDKPKEIAIDRFDTPTCVMLSLGPGEYTLRLEIADSIHMARTGEAFQDEITVYVADES